MTDQTSDPSPTNLSKPSKPMITFFGNVNLWANKGLVTNHTFDQSLSQGVKHMALSDWSKFLKGISITNPSLWGPTLRSRDWVSDWLDLQSVTFCDLKTSDPSLPLTREPQIRHLRAHIAIWYGKWRIQPTIRHFGLRVQDVGFDKVTDLT